MYAIDPYLGTTEELAQSPTYFKRPKMVSMCDTIYCFETYQDDYMPGKLVVSVFDANMLYN